MKQVFAIKPRLFYLFRLLPLLLLLCLVSSCLQIDYYVTINRDGSELVTAKIVAIKELKLDKMESQLKAHGYTTTSELIGDSVHLTATQTFAAANWAVPYPYAMLKDSVNIMQSYTNYLLCKKYKLSVRYKLDSSKVANSLTDANPSANSDSSKGLGSNLFSIPIRYHISVPGSIDTTTAANVVVNTMNWNYKLQGGQDVNIICASTEYNYTYIIILGLLIVAGVYYLIARKK